MNARGVPNVVSLPAAAADALDISLRIVDSNGRLLCNLREQLSLLIPEEDGDDFPAPSGARRQRRQRSNSGGDGDARRVRFNSKNEFRPASEGPEAATMTTTESPQELISRINCSLNRIARFAREKRHVQQRRLRQPSNASPEDENRSAASAKNDDKEDGEEEKRICRPAVPIRVVVRSASQARELHYAIESEDMEEEEEEEETADITPVRADNGDATETKKAEAKAAAAALCESLSRRYKREIILHTIGQVVQRQMGGRRQ